MRRAGRAHILTILAIVFVVVLVGIFASTAGRASETTAAKQFLSALAIGDAGKLASLSYMNDLDEAGRKASWEKTLEYTKYYRFSWRIERSHTSSPNEGIVRIGMRRNAATAGYDEFFELPMVMRDGKWLVDVYGISREMYPALPR